MSAMASSDTASSFDLQQWSSGMHEYVEGHADGGAATTSPTAKPAGRKRPRASRRAPVTLLNTDTANFRAMVQQFTGIPGPFTFPGGGGVPVTSFVADYGFPMPSGVVSLDHNQQPTSTFQQQQIRREHHHDYTGGGAFGYSGLNDLAGDEEDKMILQSMQLAAQMTFAASTANHSSSANGYFA